MQELRDRIAELEVENARLRHWEETVRRNSRLVQALLTKSREGILLVTPQMTFLSVFHSILGRNDQSLVGLPLLSVVHPEDHACALEAFASVLANPSESITCQWRVADKNGDWCGIEVEMTDMLDDPDIQAIVLNSRKIPAA